MKIRQIEAENTSDKAAHAMRVILKDFKVHKLCWGQCCGFRDHILYREWHAGITWKQECSRHAPLVSLRQRRHASTAMEVHYPTKTASLNLKVKNACAPFFLHINTQSLTEEQFLYSFLKWDLWPMKYCHMRYATFLFKFSLWKYTTSTK